jgi:hypothetical protein
MLTLPEKESQVKAFLIAICPQQTERAYRMYKETRAKGYSVPTAVARVVFVLREEALNA